MSTKLSSAARFAIIAAATAGASLALPQGTAHAAGGTTYYVSPSGSDSNSGTSASSPIKTLGRASGLPLAPGDEVLLERGGTFAGKLAIWRSGSADSPITIGAYGGGAKPVVTGDCLEVGASYITMTDLTVQGCSLNGIWTDGTGNVITNVEATHNVQGIDVGEHAQGTKVIHNYLHNNDRMAPNTPGTFDDWGAVGMVVQGDNTEVAYNTINDNWAPDPDFGTDGSAVEIYGGIGTLVHHNVAANNRTFSELGNSRSANTTYAYNQVTSNLKDTEFLVTRGAADYFGPVLGTVAVNNSVKLTGSNSLGFTCYAGCTPQLLTMYNNVLDVAGRVGYVEGSISGGDNVYWRGRTDGFKMMPGDRYVDPEFRGPKLVPTLQSPLIDAGRPAPMNKDLKGRPTDVDGNGDGQAGTDIGAFEARPPGTRHHGGKHHGQHAAHHHGGQGKHPHHHGAKPHHQGAKHHHHKNKHKHHKNKHKHKH